MSIQKLDLKVKNQDDNLQRYKASLDKEENLITQLTEQIKNTEVKTNNDFLVVKKLYKKWVQALKHANRLRVTISKLDFSIESEKLFQTRFISAKANPQQLYEYITFIEKHNNSLLSPNVSTFHLLKIASFFNRLAALHVQMTYWSNIHVLKPSYQITEQALKTKLKKLDDDIEFYRNKIDNFRTNLLARFHAGQVKKLEKSKKETIVNDINDDHVINLTKVVKYYNNGVLAIKVLKDIDLKVKFGEFVVILGPSGSGKTTLLNIISGMDNATYGSTIVAKQNLINLNASKLTVFRRNNIGYIFQQYGLLPNLTVKENVEIGANLQKDPKKRLDINELLKTIGIYEHRNKFPNELSGGQQQRVAIARSMAKNPILLFGDEPTGAIDNQMSKHILQLFVDINKKFQTTIVVVTHNPIIANLATKIVYVQDGEIAKISDNIPKTIDQLN